MRFALALLAALLLAGCSAPPTAEIAEEKAPNVERASVLAAPSGPPVVREIRSTALDGATGLASDSKSGSLVFSDTDSVLVRFARGPGWDDAKNVLRLHIESSPTLRIDGPMDAELGIPLKGVEWFLRVMPTATGPAEIRFYENDSLEGELVEVGRISYDVVLQ